MKYRTKKHRLQAVADKFSDHVKRPFSMDEVSAWAFQNNLVPVPARGDSEELCSAWEYRLENAILPEKS